MNEFEIKKSNLWIEKTFFLNGGKLVTDRQKEPMNRSDARLRQAEKDRKKTDRSRESKRQGVWRRKGRREIKGKEAVSRWRKKKER
jgi:hypothetical protein